VRAAAAEARQRQTETETLAKASWAVSSQLTTEQALTEVLEQLHRVADIETAAVISFDQDGKVLLRASISSSGDTDKKSLLAEIDKHLDRARGRQLPARRLWTPVAHGGNQAGAVYVKLNEKTEESREQQKRLIDALVKPCRRYIATRRADERAVAHPGSQRS
jgi:K+-sensing histidine kinase KdpD